MALSRCIYVQKVPEDWHGEEGVKQGLETLCGPRFPDAFPKDMVVLNLPGQAAVMFNVNVDANKIQLQADVRHPRPIIFHSDDGLARNVKGYPVRKESAFERRANNAIHGESSRPIYNFFEADFLLQCNYRGLQVQDLWLSVQPTAETRNRDRGQDIRVPGQVLNDKKDYPKVQYSSLLAVFQAIRFLPSLGYHVPGTESTANQGGLGRNMSIIDINHVQDTYGYIPFERFDPAVLSNPHALLTKCIRCGYRFQLLGVDRKMRFIAGKCCCLYSDETRKGDWQQDAFSWRTDGAKFTRLCGGRSEFGTSEQGQGGHGLYATLEVAHEPLRRTYESIAEFKGLAVPILEAEHASEKAAFELSAAANKATLRRFQYIETVRERRRFGVQFILPSTSGENWHEGAQVTLKNYVGTLHVQQDGTGARRLEEIQDGRITRITRRAPPDNRISVLAVLSLPKKWKPTTSNGQQVSVRPVINSSSHRATLAVIEQLQVEEHMRLLRQLPPPTQPPNPVDEAKRSLLQAKIQAYNNSRRLRQSDYQAPPLEDTPLIDHPLLHTIFNFPFPNEFKSWTFFPDADDPMGHEDMPQDLRKRLNAEQAEANRLANTKTVFFLHGPPGTGKTTTIATIVIGQVLKLLQDESKNLILMVAPSNESADNMASAAHTLAKKTLPGIKKSPVVRVAARAREDLSDGLPPDDPQEKDFIWLHHDVQRHPRFRTPHLKEIIECLEGGNGHLLTGGQVQAYEDNCRIIEGSIIRARPVIVGTLASLLDDRILNLVKGSVTTLVLEEASQLTVPETLAILQFQPRRIILVGDHHQLPPTVYHHPAQEAGLGRSLLEWVAQHIEGGIIDPRFKINMPKWVMLRKQYRMAEDIAMVPSTVFYENKLLTDSKSIAQRTNPLPVDFRKFFPSSARSSILVVDVKGKEQQSDNGIFNSMEAKEVANQLTKLIRAGVNPLHIVVLTAYKLQIKEIWKKVKESALCSTNNIPPAKYKAIRVCTVDSFQGQEAPVIILSLVRSNNNKAIGFLSSPKRCNVALSRAMCFQIVIGNLGLFKCRGEKLWQAIIEAFVKHASTMKPNGTEIQK